MGPEDHGPLSRDVCFGGKFGPDLLSKSLSAFEPGCVKTHTSAKCRKNNSPTRYRAESAQDDLAPLCAISPRVLLRARSALEFSHGQDPLQTWRLDSPTGNFGMSPAKFARTKIGPTSSQALSESRREWLLLTRRTPRS